MWSKRHGYEPLFIHSGVKEEIRYERKTKKVGKEFLLAINMRESGGKMKRMGNVFTIGQKEIGRASKLY